MALVAMAYLSVSPVFTELESAQIERERLQVTWLNQL
jgi:hypothetical protein